VGRPIAAISRLLERELLLIREWHGGVTGGATRLNEARRGEEVLILKSDMSVPMVAASRNPNIDNNKWGYATCVVPK
jgi:hypothetical protein